MGIWDKFYENAGYVYAQHLHKGEVKSLEAALKQKDATIETMEKHVDLLQEKGQMVETQNQGLQNQVGVLQTNLSELQDNMDRLNVIDQPTITSLTDSRTSATSIFSSSEGLGENIDVMTDAVNQMRNHIVQSFSSRNQPVKRTLLSDFEDDDEDDR